MHWSFLILAAALPAAAQPVLYACANITKDYVVGAKLPSSGMFRRGIDGKWQHIGYNHPLIFGFAADPRDPASLLLAAGNGLLRATGAGLNWTQLTGSDVTELRDVAVDPNAAGAIYFGHTAGIRASHDNGRTWQELGGSLRRKFTETIRVDPRRSGVLIAGTEEGIFRSEDDGRTWRLAGASGLQILRIEVSPHDACFWLASTQGGGLFASRDCGVTFENNGALGVGRNLYDIAFDPTVRNRIAVAGWGPGVAVSSDGGKTWSLRNGGLPRPEVTSVAFDPARSGRLFAAVHEEAVYVSEDAGLTWKVDGLETSHVNRMRFVPEVVR